MKGCAGGERGAINSAQRVREDFKKKVTLALKKAAEIWRVGDEGAGKRHSKQREQREPRRGRVNACGARLRNSSRGTVAGARGRSAGKGGDAGKCIRAQLGEGRPRWAKELGPWPAAW